MRHFLLKYGTIIALLTVSFFVFCLRFDIRILNVTNTEWLMHWSLDTGSYYLMENYFRQSAWHFPEIGIFTGPEYPTVTAIGTNDIVSLFAVGTKFLSPVLPERFQYFGIWLLLCYLMQAYWAFRFLKILAAYRQIALSEAEIFVGSLFFITAPLLLFRAGHPNMCMHAFFLAAFCNYFGTATPRKKIYIQWLLVFISTTIHLYTTAMLLVIGVALTVDLWNRKKISFLKLIGANLASATIVGVLLYFLGFFYLPFNTVQAEGFGKYSSNLNTFFNPQGYSQIFSDLKNSTEGQYEGFAYFGAGVFFILFIIVFSGLLKFFYKIIFIQKEIIEKEFFHNETVQKNLQEEKSFEKNKTKIVLPKNLRERPELFPILFITFLFFIYALSDKIGWNGSMIYEYRLGEFTQKIFHSLRGSGRFIWPVFYLLLGFILTTDFGFRKQTESYSQSEDLFRSEFQNPNSNVLRLLILVIAFILQSYDTQKLYHLHDEKITYCNGNCTYEKWLPIIAEADRVVMYKPYGWSYVSGTDFYVFWQAAMTLHKAITTGYCARPDEATQNKYTEQLHTHFEAGDLGDEKKSIIISNPQSCADLVPLAKNNSCKTFIYDGYLLTVPNALAKTQNLLAQLAGCKPVTIEKQTIGDFLNKYKNETIFCIAEQEASYKLTDDARNALAAAGIEKMKTFGWCNTLMAVIYQGRAVYSDIKTEGVHDTSFAVGQKINGFVFGTDVQLRSTGNIQKLQGYIIIGGKKSITGPGRGINFAVMDKNNTVIKIACFDTYDSPERVEY